MQFIDIQNFKTKKCEEEHQISLSPLELSCQCYHTKQDKRREPFLKNPLRLSYSEDYIEEGYSSQHSSNFIEYIFHPNIYKTFPCKFRKNKGFKPGEADTQCPYKYCPYFHDNQDLSSLKQYRNLPLQEKESVIFNQDILSDIKLLFSDNIDGICKQFDPQIRAIKEKFKKIQVLAKQAQQKEIEAKSAKLIDNPAVKLKEHFSSQVELNQSWYTPYSYFWFGEKLKLVEDRHHQFKNYKDIVNNNITATVMKYITAFLNSEGGVLYIGIDDSAVAWGFKMTQHEFDKFLLSVDREGKFNMQPPLMPQKYSIKRIPVNHHKQTKQLWILQIKVTPSEKDKKSKILTTYNRQCFMRMNASTHKLEAIDLLEYMRLNEGEKSKEIEQNLEQMGKYLQQQGGKRSISDLRNIKQLLGKLTKKVEGLITEKTNIGSNSNIK